jgi:hypothetical protein
MESNKIMKQDLNFRSLWDNYQKNLSDIKNIEFLEENPFKKSIIKHYFCKNKISFITVNI